MLLGKNKQTNKPKPLKSQALSKNKNQFLAIKNIIAEMVLGLELEILKRKLNKFSGK